MPTLVDAQLSREYHHRLGDYVSERFTVAARPEVRRSFLAATAAGDPAPVYDRTVLVGVAHAVLAAHGRDDGTVAPAASLFLAEHLPHADLHLFAGCGHLLQFEVPTRLGALIGEFLAERGDGCGAS